MFKKRGILFPEQKEWIFWCFSAFASRSKSVQKNRWFFGRGMGDISGKFIFLLRFEIWRGLSRYEMGFSFETRFSGLSAAKAKFPVRRPEGKKAKNAASRSVDLPHGVL